MNQDENNPGTQGKISAELEARMTAWVAGEASPEEAAELERLAAERPELADLKRRLEAVIKLLAESVRPDSEPLRLAKDRRAELMRTLRAPSGPAADPASDAPLFPSLAALRRRQTVERRWILAAAACLTCGLFLSVVVRSRYESGSQAKARRAQPAALEFAKEAESQPSNEVAIQLPVVTQEEAPQANPPAAYAKAASARAPVAETRTAPVFDFSQIGTGAAAPSLAAQERDAREQVAAASRHLGATGASDGISGAVDNVRSLAAAADEPTVLPPVTAGAPQDKGSYKASSTLAGTRMRADLKDVSSANSVVSAQFLDDVGGRNQEAPPAAPGADIQGQYAAEKAEKRLFAGAAGGGTPGGSDAEVNAPRQAAIAAHGEAAAETSASREPVSTFSLHVSDVSFRIAQAALARGEMPEADRIRPEEFYNAFRYGDPAPSMAEKISCRTEQSADPTMQQRNLLRIAMTVPATGRGAAEPLRLTVLLDTSGSMEREDRAAAVRKAMQVLVSLLGRDDRVTLVGFARQPRLLADQVPGDRAGTLLDVIARTPAQGGTNIEEAIKLGGELALRQFATGAQNRIVLLTDGAANLGDADPAHLAARVEALRQRGLSFDACGVGTNGIDDSVLEALTRKGSGRYYVLDTPEAADAGFARQLAGALRPAAENVKVQVRFNAARVGNYRLIGFERHRLRTEDFRDDKVGAAALAAGEAAVALYEVEALPQGEGELGEVYVRFRDTAAGAMVERSWTLPYDPYVPAFDRATPTMQLAGTAAFLAEKLRGGARAESIRLAPLAPVVNALRSHYAQEARVQELAAMYERMRRMHME